MVAKRWFLQYRTLVQHGQVSKKYHPTFIPFTLTLKRMSTNVLLHVFSLIRHDCGSGISLISGKNIFENSNFAYSANPKPVLWLLSIVFRENNFCPYHVCLMLCTGATVLMVTISDLTPCRAVGEAYES